VSDRLAQPFLTDYDLHLLGEGRHYRAYDKLGAHLGQVDGVDGVHFAVVAPNAAAVSVIGDFNGWNTQSDALERHNLSGAWHRFVPGVSQGDLYKYRLQASDGTDLPDKADPFAFAAELRPRSASMVWDHAQHAWEDSVWMAGRATRQTHTAPISIYEVHLGSWRRVTEDGSRWLTYGELATQLAEYVTHMGFTHVELLPITEHPLDASWGYQTIGYFAPTSRFGTPDEFKAFVDTLHQAGIGVILDWVPAHFPDDEHGLARFDGTYLYEHADPKQGRHPEWHTQVFNYGRSEVQNLLISNARFWIEKYHIDGLRVDAVASMLYLDYGRPDGEWIPNIHGGRENLEAIDFLRSLNTCVYGDFPDVMLIAEESTAWPGVSAPAHTGGLGFGFKWNLGWMHDTLQFMGREPIHRSHHVGDLSFSLDYAFSENFVLPLSHDEVVHGKGSIVGRMSGDEWQRFANVRLLYGYMFGHPGKKLLFMGDEFGQIAEWDFEHSLDWHLASLPLHGGLQRWVRDLNHRYRSDARLHAQDASADGFAWVDRSDVASTVVSFLRRGGGDDDPLLFVCNFTPTERTGYRIGVPHDGTWTELLNSDAKHYGGHGLGNHGSVDTDAAPLHGCAQSLNLILPPLSVLVFAPAASPSTQVTT
jgi:1,4-alpha-glucan branching enzyme